MTAVGAEPADAELGADLPVGHALVVGVDQSRVGMGSYGKLTTLQDLPPRPQLLAHVHKAITKSVPSARIVEGDIFGAVGKGLMLEALRTGWEAMQPIIELQEKMRAEIGKLYTGTVRRVEAYGCFVEIMPGTDGLLHVSEIANHRVKDVRDELKEGDQITVGAPLIRISSRPSTNARTMALMKSVVIPKTGAAGLIGELGRDSVITFGDDGDVRRSLRTSRSARLSASGSIKTGCSSPTISMLWKSPFDPE
mgnify:CR=1 FL=1